MLDRVRLALRSQFQGGFWFPWLQKSLAFLYKYACAGILFKNWLRGKDDKAQAVASEAYVLATLALGLVWIVFLHNWPGSFLASPKARFLGATIALYRVAEIEIVSLNWIFVATERLHGVRRSLALFAFNLVEVVVFSSITTSLLGCQTGAGTLENLREGAAAVFGLRLMSVVQPSCQPIAYIQVVAAATLLSVVVANLVGTVAPPER